MPVFRPRNVTVLLMAAIFSVVPFDSVRSTGMRLHTGRVQVDVLEPGAPSDPVVLDIIAATGDSRSVARFVLYISDLLHYSRDSTVLWEGSMLSHSEKRIRHQLRELPLGRYHIAVLFGFPGRYSGSWGGVSDGFYLEVREHDWGVSRLDFGSREKQAIMTELERRGLKGISRDDMARLAPDLDARLRAFEMVAPVAPQDTMATEGAKRPQYDTVEPPGKLKREQEPEDSQPEEPWSTKTDTLLAPRSGIKPMERPLPPRPQTVPAGPTKFRADTVIPIESRTVQHLRQLYGDSAAEAYLRRRDSLTNLKGGRP